MSDIALMLTIDSIVFIGCITALFLRGRLSALHPAPVYLFFHFYTVTLRLVALTLGAPPVRMPEPPTLSEIIRASQLFDFALVGATCLWLYLAFGETQVTDRMSRRQWENARLLSLSVVRIVAWLTIIVGVFGLRFLRFSNSSAVEQHYARLGDWGQSSWVTQTITWAQQGSLMLHYIAGFPALHTAATAVLFVLTMFSTARYVLVIWGIFAFYVLLCRKRLRWPPMRYYIGLLFIAILWFPLKEINASVWAGDDVRTTVSNVVKSFMGAIQGDEPGDTAYLDQVAVTISLVDEHGDFFYGGTFLPLLVSPVPRLWWPAKPKLNEYQHIISTPGRPIGTYGAITTLVGEGYANFGNVGAVLFPVLAAYLYGRAYFAAMRRPYQSVARLLYVMSASMLLEVYRGGFMSTILFPCAAAMPMTALVVLSWVFPSARRSSAFEERPTNRRSVILGNPGLQRVPLRYRG